MIATPHIDLDTLPLSELNQQWQKVRGCSISDEHYALAMLRRAAAGNQMAWSYYCGVYEAMVHGWIVRRGELLDLEERISVANEAWGKFARHRISVANEAWGKFARHMTPSKLAQFRAYPAIIQYLKRCAQSATIDAIRTRQREALYKEVFLDEVVCDIEQPSADPLEVVCLGELKEVILRVLCNDNERLLVDLLFFRQFTTHEVLACYPDRFSSIKKIHETIRCARKRLKHSEELRLFLGFQAAA